jgi:hypothetical protein
MKADLEGKAHMTTTQLAADLATIHDSRILFSHHSVGANILAGVKRLDAENAAGGRLRFATLEEAATLKGPALIDISGGRNREPKTKIDFFAATIRGQTRMKPDIAFMKLCFVDFNPQTDVDDLFNYYRNTLEALKREFPEIHFVHVTAPLTTWPTGLKWKMFRYMGREVWEDAANVKRAEFNRRLKETFGADSVFDLASAEATAPDGRLTTFEHGGLSYPSLYTGYAEDEGHLNALGQQIVGEAAIRFMAKAIRGREAVR